MAIVQNPHIGRSSGKFSTGIFSTVLGKNILRSKPIEVRVSNNLASLKARAALAKASQLSKMLAGAVNIGMEDEAVQMYPRNYFVKINYPSINVDNDLVVSVDKTSVKTGKGGLVVLDNVTAVLAAGNLTINWEMYGAEIDPTWKVCIVLTNLTTEKTFIDREAADADELTKVYVDTEFTTSDWVYIFAYDPATFISSDSVYSAITT